MKDSLSIAIGRILSDIRVGLSDEFDKNFERQGFFSEAWQRRKSPLRGDGHLLVSSGDLRRSIQSKVDDHSITFYSSSVYAGIHNEGGTIRVTSRMKRYFWHKYYEAQGSFGRKQNGSLRNDRRNRHLTSVSEFWRGMALMREGKTIRIPRRQFIGYSPEVERLVCDIIESNLSDYFNSFEIGKGE